MQNEISKEEDILTLEGTNLLKDEELKNEDEVFKSDEQALDNVIEIQEESQNLENPCNNCEENDLRSENTIFYQTIFAFFESNIVLSLIAPYILFNAEKTDIQNIYKNEKIHKIFIILSIFSIFTMIISAISFQYYFYFKKIYTGTCFSYIKIYMLLFFIVVCYIRERNLARFTIMYMIFARICDIIFLLLIFIDTSLLTILFLSDQHISQNFLKESQ